MVEDPGSFFYTALPRTGGVCLTRWMASKDTMVPEEVRVAARMPGFWQDDWEKPRSLRSTVAAHIPG